jgi:hypothetical protein
MSKLNGAKHMQQQADPSSDDEEADAEASEASEVEFEVQSLPEKDETEEELEQLAFGDSAGFRKGLSSFAAGREQEEEDQPGTGLEGLDDADVGQALDAAVEVVSMLLMVRSYSSPMLDLPINLRVYSGLPATTIIRYDLGMRQRGKIVTTSG